MIYLVHCVGWLESNRQTEIVDKWKFASDCKYIFWTIMLVFLVCRVLCSSFTFVYIFDIMFTFRTPYRTSKQIQTNSFCFSMYAVFVYKIFCSHWILLFTLTSYTQCCSTKTKKTISTGYSFLCYMITWKKSKNIQYIPTEDQ